MVLAPTSRYRPRQGMTIVPRWRTAQGKPVARRGRKARDLPRRPPGRRFDSVAPESRDLIVKANLARFTTALALLATMALSLGAGARWM